MRALAFMWALALAQSAMAASGTQTFRPWRVVMLPGTDPTQPAAVQMDRAFRKTLEAAAPHGVEFYTDPLDNLRFHGADLGTEFLTLLGKKYQDHEIDMVVGIADFALDFTERHHTQLWPGKPVLILSMEEQRLAKRGLPPEFSFVPLRIDIEGTLAIAEALQPKAQRLVVVAGSTPFDTRLAERTVAVARQRAPHRWAPETWIGLPMNELRQRLSALDRSTAVVYTTMYRNREGHTYFPFEAVKPMAEVSGAPIYGWYPTYVEHGLTAGSLVSFTEHGQRAGELAAAILTGKRAAAGASVPAAASQCTGNVARIEALGLDQGALPAGCNLVNRSPSLWRDYRGPLLIGLVVMLLQALTITLLLVQRRRLRLAEIEATQRRLELMRAMRVATLGELSASIAHEVGQPLGAIVTNTETAQLVLRNGADDRAELEAILTDVRRDALRANEVVRRQRALLQHKPLQFALLDLGATLDEALSLLEPEVRRRGMVVERRFGTDKATVFGDSIQLQQVLLNLAVNALDAMRDTPRNERVLGVSLTSNDDNGVILQVSDRGHGFKGDAQARLFESFFTTKPDGMGMGLSIVRTLVVAHGGQVSAVRREGGGSVFTVWLPRAEARAQQPAHAQAAPEGWRATTRERS